MKKGVFKIVSFGVILGVLFLSFTVKKPQEAKTLHARIGNEVFLLEVADTDALRTKGLSGHRPLAGNEGMIFVFPESGVYGFWMKDMGYPIDIIWLDEKYRIIDVKKHATPSSYPEVFVPHVSSRFVLEFSDGFFDAHHLKLGNMLEILK